MSRYRLYLASAMGILALVLLIMLWVTQQRFYPQVNVELPDHSKLVFIDIPWTSERKCRDADMKLIAAIGANCSQCKQLGSCSRHLDPAWKKTLAGEAINAYVIHSNTLRIVVNAGNASKQICIEMAEQLTHAKKQVSRCVYPN